MPDAAEVVAAMEAEHAVVTPLLAQASVAMRNLSRPHSPGRDHAAG